MVDDSTFFQNVLLANPVPSVHEEHDTVDDDNACLEGSDNDIIIKVQNINISFPVLGF
jgi:hypothetical protein